MDNCTSCFHGSDLELIEKKYGINKNDIVNFSGNVNPLGISPRLKQKLAENIELIASYPDRHYTSLRNKISLYTSAPFENILVGNGSTELISLAIDIISPKKALILGPTYSEYEKEIYLNGGSTLYYRLKEELDFEIELKELKQQLTKDIDLFIICNPNNPTSSIINRKKLRKILDHCKENDIYVLIDETYMEFVKNMIELTAVSLTNYYTNLIILRGVSKFFSAPGLRLGYCICGNENIIHKINEKKNPWTINALASLAGEIMLEDTDYIIKTKNLINQQREKIYTELKSWKNIKAFKPTANFILIKLLDNKITSNDVFEYLINNKMMIRDASTFPFLNSQFLRFCFLTPEQNNKLLVYLNEFLSHL